MRLLNELLALAATEMVFQKPTINDEKAPEAGPAR
jgi:hypothetical protein